MFVGVGVVSRFAEMKKKLSSVENWQLVAGNWQNDFCGNPVPNPASRPSLLGIQPVVFLS